MLNLIAPRKHATHRVRQIDRYTLGATTVAALTTRPREDMSDSPFRFRGEKDVTFTDCVALSPSNEEKPFAAEIEEAAEVNCAAAISSATKLKIKTAFITLN